MAVSLSRKQKQNYAQFLHMREQLSMQEVADRVKISVQTVYRWTKKGEWDKLKASSAISRVEKLNRLYAQLNNNISSREKDNDFNL